MAAETFPTVLAATMLGANTTAAKATEPAAATNSNLER
jgi:hypothetical protein